MIEIQVMSITKKLEVQYHETMFSKEVFDHMIEVLRKRYPERLWVTTVTSDYETQMSRVYNADDDPEESIIKELKEEDQFSIKELCEQKNYENAIVARYSK